jgi:hypothetical protein
MGFRTILSVLAIGVIVLAIVAFGWLFMGGPLIIEADGPASLPQDVLDSEGYSNAEVDTIHYHTRLDWGFASKYIELKSYMTSTQYWTFEGARASLNVITLPAWNVKGMISLNPIAYIPIPELLDLLVPMVLDVKFEKVETVKMDVNGSKQTVTKFEYTVPSRNEANSIYLSRVVRDDTFLIAVASQSEGANQEETLLTLMSQIASAPSK